jgi:hypothetical protein
MSPSAGSSRRSWCLRLTLLTSLVAIAACQPKDERFGFALSGDPAPEPVLDWRFTDEIDEIAIQTRTWYGLPHSTTIWCVQVEGRLFVGSYGYAEEGESAMKYWEKNVARNPDARLRIGDSLYDVTIEPVIDPGLVAVLDDAYATKYDMADVFGEDLPDWWYYGVSLRD